MDLSRSAAEKESPDSSGKPRLRIGAVSYLNTKPLVYGLESLAPAIELVYDLPSRLADQLSDGRLDAALIPSIEFLQDPGYTILSDACIGCRGPVLSVKMLSRCPMDQIQSLALDEGSRSSAVMARILLKERFGLTPRLHVLPHGGDVSRSTADAVLLIGDRAIHAPARSYEDCRDLGDQWCRWAELPFVFAMWVARPGLDPGDLPWALGAARDAGVGHLEEIAGVEAHRVGLTRAQTLRYLRDNLHFCLGPREQRGLDLFYRRAVELGIAPAVRDARFHDCETT